MLKEMLGRVRYSIWFIVIFFLFGGLIFGYELSIIAGADPFIKSAFHLSTDQISLLMGAILLGGIMSKVILVFSDIVGRRILINLTILTYILGMLLFAHAHSYNMLYIGRLFQGVALTLMGITFNMYLAEVAPVKIRGRMLITLQLAYTAGMLLASVVSLPYSRTGDWRGMFSCIIFIPIILFLFSFLLPQSPRLLILKGKLDKAKVILAKINKKLTPEEHAKEFNDLATSFNNDKKKNKINKYLNPKFVKPILIVATLYVLDMFTGIKAILQTSVLIIHQTGISSIYISIIGSILITAINFIMTFGTIYFIDIIGRKKLLKIGIGGFTITTLIMGILFEVLPVGSLKGWAMIIGLVVAVGFYAFGPSGVIGVVASEILPNRARSIGLIICGLVSNFVGLIIVSKFLVVAQAAGYGFLFLGIAACSVVYYLFCLKVVPETKGKSLEEIESEL
ncbi:MAG: sugar porter family MFS transporter [bacterium]|nr:sugar porter family MFS transporter [bacterium]